MKKIPKNKSITASTIDRVVKHCLTLPLSVKGIFDKAYQGLSRSNAIKAKCIDCMGYENWKQRINECQSYICPLWNYRPYQSSKKVPTKK